MPTRNRPELLKRALLSVDTAMRPIADRVEVVVSDGSSEGASGRVVHRLLGEWPGGYRYARNDPPLSLPGNINRAIGLANGEWILQLHDDDYLLAGAGEAMVKAIEKAGRTEGALLFGVDIVDEHGRRRKTQTCRQEEYLPPRKALRNVLTNSSFVRQPAAIVHRSAFEQQGLYDTSLGGTCDTEMWVRIFSQFGVRCVPHVTCAYTIHEGAFTAGIWNPDTIATLADVFERARALQVVSDASLRRWQADFFHQFILAGAYRHLRKWRRSEARRVLRLFDLPEVRRAAKISPKWLPLRVAFAAATVGVRAA